MPDIAWEEVDGPASQEVAWEELPEPEGVSGVSGPSGSVGERAPDTTPPERTSFGGAIDRGGAASVPGVKQVGAAANTAIDMLRHPGGNIADTYDAWMQHKEKLENQAQSDRPITSGVSSLLLNLGIGALTGPAIAASKPIGALANAMAPTQRAAEVTRQGLTNLAMGGASSADRGELGEAGEDALIGEAVGGFAGAAGRGVAKGVGSVLKGVQNKVDDAAIWFGNSKLGKLLASKDAEAPSGVFSSERSKDLVNTVKEADPKFGPEKPPPQKPKVRAVRDPAVEAKALEAEQAARQKASDAEKQWRDDAAARKTREAEETPLTNDFQPEVEEVMPDFTPDIPPRESVWTSADESEAFYLGKAAKEGRARIEGPDDFQVSPKDLDASKIHLDALEEASGRFYGKDYPRGDLDNIADAHWERNKVDPSPERAATYKAFNKRTQQNMDDELGLKLERARFWRDQLKDIDERKIQAAGDKQEAARLEREATKAKAALHALGVGRSALENAAGGGAALSGGTSGVIGAGIGAAVGKPVARAIFKGVDIAGAAGQRLAKVASIAERLAARDDSVGRAAKWALSAEGNAAAARMAILADMPEVQEEMEQ